MTVKRIDLTSNPDVDLLIEYMAALNAAYANSNANGVRMGHADIQPAYDLAVAAFGRTGQEYIEALAELETGDADFDDVMVFFKEGHAPTTVEMSAARMLLAFATGRQVRWSLIDECWTLIQAGATIPA